jgi:CDP-2,3-bis-(O-geranylgeranyl)-sn-glycerol synthase
MVLTLILQALWFILPAYTANSFPVIAKGTHPLDFSRFLKNHRVLGDGKTFEGTITGIAFGTLTGTIQVFAQPFMPDSFFIMTTEMAFLLSAGAILGDIIGAFIKRRLGIPRGGSALLLDQLDFLVVALLFSSFIFVLSNELYIVLLVMTPILHLTANRVSHFFKLKEVPW